MVGAEHSCHGSHPGKLCRPLPASVSTSVAQTWWEPPLFQRVVEERRGPSGWCLAKCRHVAQRGLLLAPLSTAPEGSFGAGPSAQGPAPEFQRGVAFVRPAAWAVPCSSFRLVDPFEICCFAGSLVSMGLSCRQNCPPALVRIARVGRGFPSNHPSRHLRSVFCGSWAVLSVGHIKLSSEPYVPSRSLELHREQAGRSSYQGPEEEQ